MLQNERSISYYTQYISFIENYDESLKKKERRCIYGMENQVSTWEVGFYMHRESDKGEVPHGWKSRFNE